MGGLSESFSQITQSDGGLQQNYQELIEEVQADVCRLERRLLTFDWAISQINGYQDVLADNYNKRKISRLKYAKQSSMDEQSNDTGRLHIDFVDVFSMDPSERVSNVSVPMRRFIESVLSNVGFTKASLDTCKVFFENPEDSLISTAP